MGADSARRRGGDRVRCASQGAHHLLDCRERQPLSRGTICKVSGRKRSFKAAGFAPQSKAGAATTLNNLAGLYCDQGRSSDAEPLYRRALTICEKVLGSEHPATFRSRIGLAGVLSQEGKYAEADAQCRDVIALQEKLLGSEHPSTAYSCYKFAYQLARQGKTKEAAEFALRAATAARNVLGEDHPDTRKYAQLVQQLSSQTAEKLMSPDGRYSVEVVRSPEDSLVLSKDGEAIAKVSTSVGPVDSLFEALWSPDESYVAVNKQRSSRPGAEQHHHGLDEARHHDRDRHFDGPLHGDPVLRDVEDLAGHLGAADLDLPG